MSASILVAYATKYGATRDMAERIALILEQAGFRVQLSASERVASVRQFDAVIIGSSIYHDNWLLEAEELLESFHEQLAAKKVWLFSAGVTPELVGERQIDDWLPGTLKSLAEHIKPQKTTLFAGKVDAETMKLDDWLVNPGLRQTSEDYRDWAIIEAWARSIAETLSNVATMN